jgi:hypothetical protein
METELAQHSVAGALPTDDARAIVALDPDTSQSADNFSLNCL